MATFFGGATNAADALRAQDEERKRLALARIGGGPGGAVSAITGGDRSKEGTQYTGSSGYIGDKLGPNTGWTGGTPGSRGGSGGGGGGGGDGGFSAPGKSYVP